MKPSLATEPLPVSRKLGIFCAVLTVFIWASFVVISRVAGKSTLTPYDITALRLGVAGTLLLPWLIQRGLPNIPWHRVLVLVGCVGLGYPLLSYCGFFLAPASHGAVLLSGALPFEIALLGLLVLGERLTARKAVGLSLIGGGIALIGLESLLHERGGMTWLGDILFLCASTSWALFTVLLKRWQIRAIDVTLCVNVVAMLLYLPVYYWFLPNHLGQASWSIILTQGFFQGVIVVCVAMITFIKATEYLGPSRISMLMSLVPGLGALMAWPVVGEPLSQHALFGIALVTSGALIGSIHRQKKSITPPQGL